MFQKFDYRNTKFTFDKQPPVNNKYFLVPRLFVMYRFE